MKLYTVLEELECAAWRAADDAIDARDVVVSLLDWKADGGDERMLRLCSIEEWDAEFAEARGRAVHHQGIILLHVGAALDERWREVPDGIVAMASPLPFTTLRERFRALPTRLAELDVRKEQLFDAFQTTYNIQQFARQAYQIIGNPLIVCNIDQRILATAGRFPASRGDITQQISQGYVAESVRASMEADDVVDMARRVRRSFIKENDIGQRWVTSIVYYKNLELGRFDVLEQNARISYLELELIDFAGRLAGIIIDRMGYAGQSAASGASVLTDLLSGSFLTERAAKEQIALTRLPIDQLYALMLVEGQRTFGSPNYRAHIGELARKVFPEGIWVSYRESFVMLVPLKQLPSDLDLPDYRGIEREMLERRDLADMLGRNGLRACFSEPFDNLLACKMRFTQCRELADVMRDETTPGDRIAFFWRYRYRVLAQIAPNLDVVDMMMDKRVVSMRRYDHEHGTAYLDTALASLAEPSSPTHAAERLAVHRNTYFYRIKQIERLFYLDMKDADDRLSVAFTSRILQGLPEQG